MSDPPLTQTREELERFFAAGRRRGFQSGDVIVSQGQSADSLHLVMRGRVRLTVTSPSGQVATLAVLVPGEIFGEQALTSASASHGVTVTALEPTDTLAIRAADFERLRAEDPSLTDRLLASLAARVRALSDNVVELLYLPAEARVLRRVAAVSRVFGDGSPGTVIPLTQEDVAALAGVARGTANRVLREAERKGILRLGRARMTLLDPESLATQAGLEQLPVRKLAGPQPPAALHVRRPAPPAGLERRVVSLLLAQLSVTGAGSDPEGVRDLETAFQAALTAAVHTFGGSLQARGGMAAMAVFGAPVARREDAEHAVRAGLRVLEEMAAIDATGHRASVRVGIETGMALVPMAASGREPLATGQVVDVASRLAAGAPPGAVLVGPETHRATRRLIRYEPLQAIEVEPGGEAFGVWRAAEPIPERELPEPGITIVGRESELGLLQAIWTQVREERRPHLVTVVGDPGIGKSRLAREFARQVQEQGMYALYGRSLPYGGRTGYGPVAQQLKSLAGISDSDPAEDARQQLDRLATELLGADPGDVSEHLALLLGLGEDTPADRQALFLSVRRLLEAIARTSPALLVFEDLHWADPSQLDLLTWLVSRVRDAPVLFLALARPELFERVPTWGAGPSGQTTLRLEPLSQATAHRLLGQLLPADDELVTRLADKAEGNPLFIEELAASVSEGVAWESGQLPATVMVTIASRLDALPGPARQVLRAASVVGRWFWRGALGRYTHGVELDTALDLLEERGVIVREPTSRFATEPEYRFKHILIREVAYDMMPRQARQERHAVVARYLERVTRERAAEWASVLAYHWRQAGNREKAFTHLLLAAELAGRSWAKGEAASLYAQALELLAGNDPRRGSIRLNRTLALIDVGDYPAAVAELDDLIPRLEPQLRLEALVARGVASEWVSDPQGLRVHATQAVELARSLSDPELEGPALALLARAHSADGDNLTSLEVAERALAVWRPGVRTADRAYHIELTGLANYWLDHYTRSEDLLRQACEIARDVHSVSTALRAGATLGLTLAGQGRMEESLQAFAEVTATAPELEQVPRWSARALNMWAGVLRELQDFDEARRLNEEGIDLAARAAFDIGHSQGGIDLLYIALATEEVGAAEIAWPRLWEEAQASTMVHRWLMSGRLLTAKAQIELALGRTGEAADAAQRAVQEHLARGRTRYEVISRLALGSALLRLRQRSRGLAQLSEALAAAERIRHGPSIWRAAHTLGRALTSSDEKAAEASIARGQAAVRGVAASLSPERRAKFLAAPAIVEVLTGP